MSQAVTVGAFYVEIWYDREQNSITAITCFDDVSKLDVYLEVTIERLK